MSKNLKLLNLIQKKFNISILISVQKVFSLQKMVLKIIFTIFNLSIQILIGSFSHFGLKRNSNVTLSFNSQFLIQQNMMKSKMMCLALCKNQPSCNSVCYSEQSSKCYLYNNTVNLTGNDTYNDMSATIFIKKGN